MFLIYSVFQELFKPRSNEPSKPNIRKVLHRTVPYRTVTISKIVKGLAHVISQFSKTVRKPVNIIFSMETSKLSKE